MKRNMLYLQHIINSIGIIFILTGCTISETPTNLMEAPKGERWLNELRKQMNDDLPMNYQLLTPISNKHKQEVYVINTNKYGKKEVLFLYKKPYEDYQVYLSIYKETNTGWKLQSTRNFLGETVDVFEVGNYQGNSKREILIGISQNRKASNNTMYVLSVENNNITEIYNHPYTKLFIDDLNQNNINDISLVTYEKNQQLKVEFIEQLKTLSSTSFDPYINKIQKVQLGNISEKEKAIIIDAGIGAHSGITYIARFEKNEFKSLFSDENNPFINEFMSESQDVNGDEIVEFAKSVRPRGWEEHSYAGTPLFVRYVKWDGNTEFKPIEERYVNTELGYYVAIPKKLIGKITLQEDSKTTQRFLYTNTDKTWLEVHTFDYKEWPKIKNYEAAVKTRDHVYAISKNFNYPKLKSYIKSMADYQRE